MTATAPIDLPIDTLPRSGFASDFRIILDDLSLSRGDRLLMNGLSATLSAGELLYITGENGIGKTSLLLAFAGLLKPTQGEILFQDEGAFVDSKNYVSLLSQPDGASPGLTAREDLRIYLRLHGRADQEQSLFDHTELDIAADVRTENLSLGQRKRLAFAKIIAAQRQVWLLDEPFSALDETGRAFVRNTLQHHIRNNGLCLIATHDPVKLEGIKTRILNLQKPQQTERVL